MKFQSFKPTLVSLWKYLGSSIMFPELPELSIWIALEATPDKLRDPQ